MIGCLHESNLVLKNKNMSIWFKEFNLQELKDMMEVNGIKHLGIEVTEIGDNYLEGTMPVDHRTTQPLNVLHGGASCTLAESIGSIASNLVFDSQLFVAVGSSFSASYVRPVRNGVVTARATPIHIGKTNQIWNIKIRNAAEKLVCESQLTMAVLENKNKSNINFNL